MHKDNPSLPFTLQIRKSTKVTIIAIVYYNKTVVNRILYILYYHIIYMSLFYSNNEQCCNVFTDSDYWDMKQNISHNLDILLHFCHPGDHTFILEWDLPLNLFCCHIRCVCFECSSEGPLRRPGWGGFIWLLWLW